MIIYNSCTPNIKLSTEKLRYFHSIKFTTVLGIAGRNILHNHDSVTPDFFGSDHAHTLVVIMLRKSIGHMVKWVSTASSQLFSVCVCACVRVRVRVCVLNAGKNIPELHAEIHFLGVGRGIQENASLLSSYSPGKKFSFHVRLSVFHQLPCYRSFNQCLFWPERNIIKFYGWISSTKNASSSL